MWDQAGSNSEALIRPSNMVFQHDSERETSGRWDLGTSVHSMHFLYLDTSTRTQHALLLFKASGQNLNTYHACIHAEIPRTYVVLPQHAPRLLKAATHH